MANWKRLNGKLNHVLGTMTSVSWNAWSENRLSNKQIRRAGMEKKAQAHAQKIN